MIIAKDIDSYSIDLQNILSLTVKEIEKKSITDNSLLKKYGNAFEKIVCDTLNTVSEGTAFHKIFEQTSTHAFPDIYAKILEKNWFGVEVKTSQNDWKCFGNSIFESTRIQNLEDRIYVFFGKFSNSALECRWAKYDTCIDNINITHSPRYQINMDIKGNNALSVFSKMDTTYLKFSNCSSTERMDYVRKFKRKNLGQDVALWWLPDHEEPTIEDEKKLIIKLFSDLNPEQKVEIRNIAIVLFPEIFSKDPKKYFRLLPWLASRYGVVTGNIRDNFTAGGKKIIEYQNVKYSLPKICFHILTGKKEIKSILSNINLDDLINRWELPINTKFETSEDKISHWIDLVTLNLNQQLPPNSTFPSKAWLKSLFLINK